MASGGGLAYQVELDVWDWAAGQDFITKISDALERCDRVLALWSAEYFSRSRYTTREWSAALVAVPGAAEDRLMPLRVPGRRPGPEARGKPRQRVSGHIPGT